MTPIEEKVARMIKAMKREEEHEKLAEHMISLALLPMLKDAPPRLQEKILERVRPELKLERLEEEAIPIYCEMLSEEEVDAVTAFYESPEGQSYAKKSYQMSKVLSERIVNKTRKRMEASLPNILAEIMSDPEILRELGGLPDFGILEDPEKPEEDEKE